MIAGVGEERVLGLVSASLESIATGMMGRGENSKENYFRQEQLSLKSFSWTAVLN